MMDDEYAQELIRRNRRTQVSLAIFCGIGILFLAGIVINFSGLLR